MPVKLAPEVVKSQVAKAPLAEFVDSKIKAKSKPVKHVINFIAEIFQISKPNAIGN